jgi:membrane-associated protease RseP (regulator of RpoE activity)
MKEEVEREIAMVRPDIDIMRNDRFRTMPHAPMMPPPGPGAFQYFENGPGDRAFAFSMGKGRLGVTVQDMTPELAEFFAVKDGVLVSSVAKDTPAAKAGIKAGDVITAIDGATVESSNELVDQLREKNGDVTLALMRDKKAMTIKATLEKQATPKPKVMIRGIAT